MELTDTVEQLSSGDAAPGIGSFWSCSFPGAAPSGTFNNFLCPKFPQISYANYDSIFHGSKPTIQSIPHQKSTPTVIRHLKQWLATLGWQNAPKSESSEQKTSPIRTHNKVEFVQGTGQPPVNQTLGQTNRQAQRQSGIGCGRVEWLKVGSVLWIVGGAGWAGWVSHWCSVESENNAWPQTAEQWLSREATACRVCADAPC
uniref:HDC16127 n=1 Tax=Drosophila melanogaster TaxID=7227 RepID=Q6IJ19_DROME|nr:TPA_inf: HDC16127 [Drosophila melanogaster]